MIIGISGAQGQGKSTLKKLLCEKYHVEEVNANLSRSILEDMGKTLDEVNRDLDLKCVFQNKLLLKMEYNMWECSPDKIYISDRTFLDLFVYTLISLGPFNKYSDFLDLYYEKCLLMQQRYININFFLTGRTDYKPQDDGVRSFNVYFTKLVDNEMSAFLSHIKATSDYVISTSDLSERVNSAKKILASLYSQFNEEHNEN